MSFFIYTSFFIFSLSLATASIFSVTVLNHLNDLKLKGYSGFGLMYHQYKQIGGAIHFVTGIVTLCFLHFLGFLNALQYLTFIGFALLFVVLGYYDFRLKHYKYLQMVLLVLLSFFVVYFHKSHFINYKWDIVAFDAYPYVSLVLFTSVIVGVISLLLVIDNLNKRVVSILALIIVVLFCCLEAKKAFGFYYFNLSIIATLCVVIYFELFADRALYLGKGGVYLLGFYFSVYSFHLLS